MGGCGRFFEGTASDMYQSLFGTLLLLPSDTRIYCGHEYTVSNLKFALSIDPENETLIKKLHWARKRVSEGLPTVPSTLEEEMKYNPFLRIDNPTIQTAVGGSTPISVLSNLRKAKDNF